MENKTAQSVRLDDVKPIVVPLLQFEKWRSTEGGGRELNL